MIGGGLGGAPQAASGIMILLLAAIPGYFAWRNLKKAFGSDGPRAPALPRETDTGWRQDNAFNQPSSAPLVSIGTARARISSRKNHRHSTRRAAANDTKSPTARQH